MTKTYSRLIQGCMTWGIWGNNFSVNAMSKRISETVDLGITTFDHADIYGNYTTEATFGEAFQKTGIVRPGIQLISKCGIQLINETRGSYVKHYNYSKDYIIAQAEASLKKLKTDYLDLFLLHRPSPLMEADEVKEAIATLKTQGKIRGFGVSNFTPQQIDYLKGDLEIEANQIQCSLTHVSPFEDDTLFYHQQHHIKSMAWSPLGSFYNLGEGHPLTQTILKMSEQYSCSSSQVVLAWLLQHPSKIYPVLGTTSTTRMKEAVKSPDIKLSSQDWFVLFEASRGKEVA